MKILTYILHTDLNPQPDSRSIDLNQQKRPRTDRFVSRPEDINLVELEPIQLRNDFIDNQDMWIDNPSFQGGLEVDAFDVGEVDSTDFLSLYDWLQTYPFHLDE